MKKSQKRCNKAAVSCIVFSEVVTCSAKKHVFPLRLFIHKLSKHDHGAAEVQTSSQNDKLIYMSTNFNLAPSKKERMLIINKSLNLSLFIVFYFSTKYLIMLGKVADQGPHTNCTSHSLTFPPPIDLQPSFCFSSNIHFTEKCSWVPPFNQSNGEELWVTMRRRLPFNRPPYSRYSPSLHALSE